MADYSKFKNAKGDDLVLQDSRVDTISEKVEGIEAGAEVNKIEGISIDYTEMDIYNKKANISLGAGLQYDNINNELTVRTGTGGIVISGTDIDILCKSPLRNAGGDYPGVELRYDNTLTKINYSRDPERPDEKLSVKTPVPTPITDHSDVGKVLTVHQASDPNDSDEIVWAAPTTLHVDDDTIKNTNGTLSVNYGDGLTVYGYAGANKLCVANPVPTFTTADAGKVLTINAAGNGLEWTLPNVPANAVSLNNEPVGVNGDYFTVGEGQ